MLDAQGNESISARVDRTLDDLHVIQHTLLAFAEPGQRKDPGEHLAVELAGELKILVDGLRQLLWAYIQDVSSKSGRTPEEVQEWCKMEMAVELLRAARKRPARMPEVPPQGSFQQLVSNALAVTAQYTGQENRLQ